MKSSTTSSWESTQSRKLLEVPEKTEEDLITNSTRELVEFYWSNRKRFSGGYRGYPTEVS